MPLIPEKGGKLRAIGIFVAPVRIWGKIRRAQCDEWERRYDRAFFAAGAGRSPVSPVWRAAVLAEAGAKEGCTAASVLADIGTFFDRMPHKELRKAAREWGFPIPLLECALSLYKGARYVEWGAATADPVYARRGVVAGCSLCTTLAKLILIGPLSGVTERHPRITLDVFVDDLHMGAVGDQDGVVRRLREVFEDVDQVLSAAGVPLAAAKTAVTASSKAVAARIRVALRIPAPANDAAGEFLGSDFVPGAHRKAWAATSKRRGRMRAALARRARLHRLRRAAGPRAAAVATAGLLPQASYAAEVTGITPHEARALRRTAARAMDSAGAGRSAERLLLVQGDPVAKLVVAPVVRWAEEVWNRTAGDSHGLTIGTLARAHAATAAKPPKRWQEVRGPTDAAWLTLHQLGWRWQSPFKLVDGKGTHWGMAAASPRLLRNALLQAVKSTLEKRAADALRAKGLEVGPGRISTAPVARTLRSAYLSAKQKGAVRAVVTDALWTDDRLAAEGYDVDPCCKLCSTGARDTVWHRAWECPATQDLRTAEPDLVVRALAAGPSDPTYARALPPHPADGEGYAQAAASPQAVHWGWKEGELVRFPPGDVFVDGSCVPDTVAELSRAAWAAVMVDHEGRAVRGISGLVPVHLPQTAPAAEFCALEAVAATTGEENRILGDCQAVVNGATAEPDAKRWGRMVHGGTLKAAERYPESRAPRRGMVKVKAHQSFKGLEGEDLHKARGNDAADTAAKAAVARHPPHSQRWTEEAAVRAHDAEAVARLIGRAVARWPRQKRAELRENRPNRGAERGARRKARAQRRAAREACAKEALRSHDWAWWASPVRCRQCLARRTANTPVCGGDPEGLAARADSALLHGHCMGRGVGLPPAGSGTAAPATPFVACLRCGAWESAGRSTLLSGQCVPPGRNGAAALGRLSRGLFPRPGGQWAGYLVPTFFPWRRPSGVPGPDGARGSDVGGVGAAGGPSSRPAAAAAHGLVEAASGGGGVAWGNLLRSPSCSAQGAPDPPLAGGVAEV